jgi:hypothetical protein
VSHLSHAQSRFAGIPIPRPHQPTTEFRSCWTAGQTLRAVPGSGGYHFGMEANRNGGDLFETGLNEAAAG